MLLPVDWDGNDLLFIKRLHMMNRAIGCSYANTNMNRILLCGTYKSHVYIIILIFFQKLNARIQVQKQNGAKLFGPFRVRYCFHTG